MINKKNILFKIIFSSYFPIILFLIFSIGLLIYIKYPSTIYTHIINNISIILKTIYETHGNIYKIDNGLHKSGELIMLLSVLCIAFIQLWEWIFRLTNKVTTISTIAIYDNLHFKKNDWIIIAIFMALAFILGILRINQSLWQDEIGVYQTFMAPGILSSIFPKSSMGSHPLMQVITKLFIDVAGVSEFTLRFPSFFLSILSIPLFYILSAKLTGEKLIGILSSFLLTINSFHVYYSFQMRGYSFLMFFSIISIYLFIKLIIKPTNQTAVLLSIINILLLYTHLYTIFFIGGQCLTIISLVLYQHYFNKYKDIITISDLTAYLYFLSFIWTLLIFFIIFIPYIPIIGMNIFNLEINKGSFLSHIYKVIRALFLAVSFSKYKIFEFLFLLSFTGISIILINKKNPIIIFINTFFITYLIIVLILKTGGSGFELRYLTPIIPIMILLLAIVIHELYISPYFYSKFLSLILICAYCALSISAFPRVYMPIQDYKGAVNFVNTIDKNQDDVIIVSNSLGKDEVRFYDKKIIPLNNIQELNYLLTSHKNIYAITTLEDYAGKGTFINDGIIQKEIESKFKPIKTFRGSIPVHVWLYYNKAKQ